MFRQSDPFFRKNIPILAHFSPKLPVFRQNETFSAERTKLGFSSNFKEADLLMLTKNFVNSLVISRNIFQF